MTDEIQTCGAPVTGLLPCPFCGVAPGLTKVADGPIFIIHCTNDACEVRCETSASTPENARDAWNARSGAAQSPDTRVRLRELVDVVWKEATESEAVPSTKWADKLIDRVFAALPQPGAVEPDRLCDCCQPSDGAICRCEMSNNPFWRGYSAGSKAPRHFPGQSPALDPATVEACAKMAENVDDVLRGGCESADQEWLWTNGGREMQGDIIEAIRALLASGASNADTSTPSVSAFDPATLKACADMAQRWSDEAAKFKNEPRCELQSNVCRNLAQAIRNLSRVAQTVQGQS